MPVKTPAAAAAALLLVLAPLTLATAQTSGSSYVFETVDSIDTYLANNGLKLTGILQGEATARTLAFNTTYGNSAEAVTRACERYALISMSKPGLYYLEVRTNPASTTLQNCKLTRR